MHDRAISMKCLTHRVTLQINKHIFWKNFCLAKTGMLNHFEFSNFSQKLQNTKMLISRKPCKIERFQQNFRPTGYLCRSTNTFFEKYLSRQNGGHFDFSNFSPKNAYRIYCNKRPGAMHFSKGGGRLLQINKIISRVQ